MSRHKSAVFLCLLFVSIVNITSLNDRPVTLDDLDSIKHIYGLAYNESYSLRQTLESVVEFSPEHAPVYYLVLNVWRVLVGDDLLLARLLSVYFWLVAIALVSHIALLTGDRRAAVAAPWILALLAYPYYYAQIARVYALLPLVCGWVIWSFWQVVRTTRVSRWKWLSFYASVATVLYVHYVGVILLAALAVYHLLFVSKTRRWLNVASVMVAASLPFILWLPVVFRGFARSQSSLTKAVLSLPEAALALMQLYSNGLWPLPVAAALLLIHRRKRLHAAARYLSLVALAIFLMLLLVNEFSPILVERRMRYTVVLALPLSCFFAVALAQLPLRRALGLLLLALGIASSIHFAGSLDLQVYTNRRFLELDMVPHYQDFIYEADSIPGYHEPILSFHPRHSGALRMMLPYYRHQLSDWTHVLHMSHNPQGALVIESSLSTYESPDAIVDNSLGIWLVHNPILTSESVLDTDFAWVPRHFNFCKRYVDKPENAIDFYLKSSLPCTLVTDEAPFAIRYDNGTELGNLLHDHSPDLLTLYLRWLHSIDKVYAFTLQVFDEKENKVAQYDRVISGDPIDIATFNLKGLPAGEYVVRLIVYDRESGASQPGTVLTPQQEFERAADVLRFTVSD